MSFFRRRKSSGELENAKAANQSAEDQLSEVMGQREEVNQVALEMSRHLQENHLAESIISAMRLRPPRRRWATR